MTPSSRRVRELEEQLEWHTQRLADHARGNMELEEQLEARERWLEECKKDCLYVKEQFDALRLAATRQLTPLDVAATHIEIIRRKGDDYTARERDNVAAIVESHVKEARAALFAAIDSNPASDDFAEVDPNIEPGCCGQCGPRGCGDIDPFDQDKSSPASREGRA